MKLAKYIVLTEDKKEVRFFAVGTVNEDGTFTGMMHDYTGGGNYEEKLLFEDKWIPEIDSNDEPLEWDTQVEIFNILSPITVAKIEDTLDDIIWYDTELFNYIPRMEERKHFNENGVLLHNMSLNVPYGLGNTSFIDGYEIVESVEYKANSLIENTVVINEKQTEMMAAVVLEDTIKKIKNDLENEDESYLAAVISGDGHTPINNLNYDELESEYRSILDSYGYIEPTLNSLKKAYVDSENCSGEFADYVYENMEEFFPKPHNIAQITKAIQEFRTWSADEKDTIVDAEINYIQDVKITNVQWDGDVKDISDTLEINLPYTIFESENPQDYAQTASDYISDLITNSVGFCHKGFSDTFDKKMYFINEYQDYMYADNTFVEAGVRVGIIEDKELILDKGITYADNARTVFLPKSSDSLQEVELYEERANRTLHGLKNGLAYYNYEGVHFRVFNSFKDGMFWLDTRNDNLVIAEFENEQGLDSYLGAE